MIEYKNYYFHLHRLEKSLEYWKKTKMESSYRDAQKEYNKYKNGLEEFTTCAKEQIEHGMDVYSGVATPAFPWHHSKITSLPISPLKLAVDANNTEIVEMLLQNQFRMI